MNHDIQTIVDFIQNLEAVSPGDKTVIVNALKQVDKNLEIVNFKLDRTEKVKRTTTILLEETIEELEQKRKAIESAQAQLIQAEKMASLGELTAGIAHEIQNPLNFVNNFSDVSKELLQEMTEEIAGGNFDDVKILAATIQQNLEKINHHGKRADAIVKGMLQHSQAGTGIKSAVNINTLVVEYQRLAYLGYRAKDKAFNTTLETTLDESIGHIQVIPQDIGRVLLNLFNNAFYAVHNRALASGTDFEPSVFLSTKQSGQQVEIQVRDNGLGIPGKIIEKIFQPFFTTKPTGQGTGLGLSLSYDIVKAHGGSIDAYSRECEGSTFTVYLPV